MAKLKFTKTALLALLPPDAGKRLAIYDTEVPKLAMRITATGTRTFYVIKRAGASIAWVKLGTVPEMTVEQARAEAQKVLGEFATGASSPSDSKRTDLCRDVRGLPRKEEKARRHCAGRENKKGLPRPSATAPGID